MLNYRVYPISIFESWQELAKNFLSLKYDDNVMKGVKLKDVSATLISGTYYEKIIYSEIINHPLNGIETITQESYLHTEFDIYRDSALFILKNPSRRPNSIFKFLALHSNNVLSVSNNSIDVLNFCHNSMNRLREFKVRKVFYAPFSFIQNSIASISISSINDALEDSAQFGINLPNTIQKISFECRYQDKKVVGSVSMNGSISISNSAGQSFFEDILKVALG